MPLLVASAYSEKKQIFNFPETTRRCGFFFDIFGLGLPDYLNCNILHDSTDPDVCVGYMEVQKARTREIYPCKNTEPYVYIAWYIYYPNLHQQLARDIHAM